MPEPTSTPPPDHPAIAAVDAALDDHGRPATPTADVRIGPAPSPPMTPDPDADPDGRRDAMSTVSRRCWDAAWNRDIQDDPVVTARLWAELDTILASRDPKSDPRRLLRKADAGHRSSNPSNALVVELLGLGEPGSTDLTEPPTFLPGRADLCRPKPRPPVVGRPRPAPMPPAPARGTAPPMPAPEGTPASGWATRLRAARERQDRHEAEVIAGARAAAGKIAALLKQDIDFDAIAPRFDGVRYATLRTPAGWSLAIADDDGPRPHAGWDYPTARRFAAHVVRDDDRLADAMADVVDERTSRERDVSARLGEVAAPDVPADVTTALDDPELIRRLGMSSDDIDVALAAGA